MEVIGYHLSTKFERFYKEQKNLLCLDDIVFVPMSEHPNKAVHGGDYGTTLIDEGSKVLRVFLNPDRFNRQPAEERELVAEIIAVHEILHRWTIAKGFPEVNGADEFAELRERFINLFHHRVINREMEKLGYNYSIPDRLVAQQFIELLQRETSDGPLRTFETNDVGYSLFIIILATVRDQFTSEEYEKVTPYFAYSNTEVLRRGELCADLIDESKCWESPIVMFEVMNQVREILGLESNILDFKNPETGEWTDPDTL